MYQRRALGEHDVQAAPDLREKRPRVLTPTADLQSCH